MDDLPVKPQLKTVIQTAIIINRSRRTIERYADEEILEWCDGQITVRSIHKYMERYRGLRKGGRKETENNESKETKRKVIYKGVG